MAEINDALRALTSVNNIGFTEFTTGLIQGVFKTIVDSTLDQMNAYASLVSQLSISLTEFTNQAVGTNNENALLVLKNDLGLVVPTGANPSIPLNEDQFNSLVNTFIGITVNGKLISDTSNMAALAGNPPASSITVNKLLPFVVEKIKLEATDRYNLLRTLVQLGMQKVVVSKGHIRTKLTFSVDFEESFSTSSQTTNSQSTSFGFGGGGGFGIGAFGGVLGTLTGVGLGGGAASKKIKVNVVNAKSSAATNLNADIIGEVLIEFRTDSFPIANF